MAGMISLLKPLPVGNAVQITVDSLPATAVHWRLLRNTTGLFPAFNDSLSVVVTDSNAGDPLQLIDTADGLINGTVTFYQLFYFDGSAWSVDPNSPASCTPATTYIDDCVDAQTIVTDRLRLGIAAEIARGGLVLPPNNNNELEVLTAPPNFDNTRWPVISVHLNNETPVNRAIGEGIANDEFDTSAGLWDDHDGWQAKTQLGIVGWSLNSDERIVLRKAIRRIILANLAVFDAALLLQVELNQQDVEDFTTYQSPVYETVCLFTCVTPLAINAPGAPITDVEVTVTVTD